MNVMFVHFGTCRIFEDVSVDVVHNMFSVMFLEKVISIEKMEDTSLLPNPIIVSIRSKTAFQFIELKDRDTLVENLLQRLKQVNSSNPVHCNNLQNKNQVPNFGVFLYFEFTVSIYWSIGCGLPFLGATQLDTAPSNLVRGGLL